eukprot:6081213-Pleurochrysis_carterae.AAC.1
MRLVSTAALLSADKCSAPGCAFGQTCLQSNFTLRTLRNCAAITFGESVLDGKKPTIGNHAATPNWFKLVYDCRVVVGDQVTGIDLRVEGRRVCEGAFAA